MRTGPRLYLGLEGHAEKITLKIKCVGSEDSFCVSDGCIIDGDPEQKIIMLHNRTYLFKMDNMQDTFSVLNADGRAWRKGIEGMHPARGYQSFSFTPDIDTTGVLMDYQCSSPGKRENMKLCIGSREVFCVTNMHGSFQFNGGPQSTLNVQQQVSYTFQMVDVPKSMAFYIRSHKLGNKWQYSIGGSNPAKDYESLMLTPHFIIRFDYGAATNAASGEIQVVENLIDSDMEAWQDLMTETAGDMRDHCFGSSCPCCCPEVTCQEHRITEIDIVNNYDMKGNRPDTTPFLLQAHFRF